VRASVGRFFGYVILSFVFLVFPLMYNPRSLFYHPPPTKPMTNRQHLPNKNAHMGTVAMFAQCVYLMFSSVYVCKETVEHHRRNEEPTTLE
jgi:hypothetical protein